MGVVISVSYYVCISARSVDRRSKRDYISQTQHGDTNTRRESLPLRERVQLLCPDILRDFGQFARPLTHSRRHRDRPRAAAAFASGRRSPPAIAAHCEPPPGLGRLRASRSSSAEEFRVSLVFHR